MSNLNAQRVFFAFNGPGPYECAFRCGIPVLPPWEFDGGPRDSLALLVHHENHVRNDDRPENLVAAHYGCHTRHHMLGGPASRAGKASWKTPEQRAAHAEATAERNRERGRLGLDRGKPKSFNFMR